MSFKRTWSQPFDDSDTAPSVAQEGAFYASGAIRYALNPSSVYKSPTFVPGSEQPCWRHRGPNTSSEDEAPGNDPTWCQTPQTGGVDSGITDVDLYDYGMRVLGVLSTTACPLASWADYATDGLPLQPVSDTDQASLAFEQSTVTDGDSTAVSAPVSFRDWCGYVGGLNEFFPNAQPGYDIPAAYWSAIPAAAQSAYFGGGSVVQHRQWSSAKDMLTATDPDAPGRIVASWGVVLESPFGATAGGPSQLFPLIVMTDIPANLSSLGGSPFYAEDVIDCIGDDVAFVNIASWTYDAGAVGNTTVFGYTASGYVAGSPSDDIQPAMRPALFIANGSTAAQTLLIALSAVPADPWNQRPLFGADVSVEIYRWPVRLVEHDGVVIFEATGSESLVATLQSGLNNNIAEELAALGATAYDASNAVITPAPDGFGGYTGDDPAAIAFPLDAAIPVGLWAIECRCRYSGWSSGVPAGWYGSDWGGSWYLTNAKPRPPPHGRPSSTDDWAAGSVPSISLTKA